MCTELGEIDAAVCSSSGDLCSCPSQAGSSAMQAAGRHLGIMRADSGALILARKLTGVAGLSASACAADAARMSTVSMGECLPSPHSLQRCDVCNPQPRAELPGARERPERGRLLCGRVQHGLLPAQPAHLQPAGARRWYMFAPTSTECVEMHTRDARSAVFDPQTVQRYLHWSSKASMQVCCTSGAWLVQGADCL